MSEKILHLLRSAIDDLENRRYIQAESALLQVIKLKPSIFDAHYILGIVYGSQAKNDQAKNCFARAVKLDPKHGLAHYNLAKALSELGQNKQAIPHHIKATQLIPNHSETWLNYGKSLYEIKKYQDAIHCYKKALDIQPDLVEVFSNLGSARTKLDQLSEALLDFDKALQLSSKFPEVWSNKGVALLKMNRFEEALIHFDRAIELKIEYPEALTNKGITLAKINRHQLALKQFDAALAINGNYVEAWRNKGNALLALGQYAEALPCYEKAKVIGAGVDDLTTGSYMHCQMFQNQWDLFANNKLELINRLKNQELVVEPFVFLSISDNPGLQLKCAQIASKIYSSTQIDTHIPSHARNDGKIKLAYFSADFKEHPVAYLTTELLESHDKEKFELFAFSFDDAPADDATRERLLKVFDHWLDVKNLSDQEVANLARQRNVDIAIDLGGYTKSARTGIFANRAAPVQVNFIGYPGTMGAEFMDYIVADRILIPESHERFYQEKIVSLPGTFQPYDSKRKFSNRLFNRQELKLPKVGFIYCCFNNGYKINPEIFDAWAQILKSTKDSYLWLYANSSESQVNLIREGEKRSIEAERFIFAPRVSSEDYLARFKVADLFLDTLPFGGGTTTRDALWMGLPVLTTLGESFAGRMSASILHAAGAQEFICENVDQYISKAIEFANHPLEFNELKLQLKKQIERSALFDSDAYTRHLEEAYVQMHQRKQLHQSPAHIRISHQPQKF